ncbi:uncharacterized protein [Primulina eburnea]|uniref:uncharacterized protein n=1 Tax=Primulina eburnea TaxID=1245227 RepID=UPI003C6C8AB5
MANNSRLIVEDEANQHYVVTQGRSNGIFQVPVPIPQLIRCQQTPQSYVKFLAESGYPEIQNIFPHKMSAPISSLGLENHSQKQDSNEDYGSAFQAYLGSGATALKYPPNASLKRSREKAHAADRNRRLKITQRLDALQDMFPHFKEGCKADLVDYVVDQVKYLQYQVKDLCQSKLGGEPSSSSSIFLEVKLYESMGMPDMQEKAHFYPPSKFWHTHR